MLEDKGEEGGSGKVKESDEYAEALAELKEKKGWQKLESREFTIKRTGDKVPFKSAPMKKQQKVDRQ